MGSGDTITTLERIPESAELKRQLAGADHLKAELERARPLDPQLWETIQLKLKIDWTYASNAIEGSTLTRGETAFFLQEGLTVEGKPFKDFLDARNHADAIDFLHQVVRQERLITPGLLKEFNALLLSGVTHTDALTQKGQQVKKPASPGQFKRQPNHVLQHDGTIHYYTSPEQTPGEVEALCDWIEESLSSDALHPVMVSAIAHYEMVRIHPFDDGNGRGARLLMNLILLRAGFPPAIIRREARRRYLAALAAGDRGELGEFVKLVVEGVVHGLEGMVAHAS